MKFVFLFLVTLIATFVGLCVGDTRVLHNVVIYIDNSNRAETFSLNNENTPEEELVIKGTETQTFPAGDADHVYVVEKIYVADKDGYRVKYKLVREKKLPSVQYLNPLTLKSLGR